MVFCEAGDEGPQRHQLIDLDGVAGQQQGENAATSSLNRRPESCSLASTRTSVRPTLTRSAVQLSGEHPTTGGLIRPNVDGTGMM